MSDFQNKIYTNFAPKHCDCQGYGWARDEAGNLHPCPLHGGDELPHPDEVTEEEFNTALHAAHQECYAEIVHLSKNILRENEGKMYPHSHRFMHHFNMACIHHNGEIEPCGSIEWLNLAEDVLCNLEKYAFFF